MPSVTAVEKVKSPEDFERLIVQCMGINAGSYYHAQISQLSDLIRELDIYVDDKDVHTTVKEVLRVYGY